MSILLSSGSEYKLSGGGEASLVAGSVISKHLEVVKLKVKLIREKNYLLAIPNCSLIKASTEISIQSVRYMLKGIRMAKM